MGAKATVLQVLGGGRPEDLVHHLTPKPGAALQFTLAGNPDTVYMPYWQVGQEEFTCFPVIDTGTGSNQT